MQAPNLNSPAERVRWIIYLLALGLIAMGFYLREPYRSAHIAECLHTLQTGSTAERESALQDLVQARAEDALSECLTQADPRTAQLATLGLWECWLSERGTAARRQIEAGTVAMNAHQFATAERIFAQLIHDYPDWAEALNKLATLRYLQHRPAESLALCRQVVALKPNHFGAWSGLALCAIQLEDWPLARQAANRAVRLQPQSESNRQILRAIDQRIPKLDV